MATTEKTIVTASAVGTISVPFGDFLIDPFAQSAEDETDLLLSEEQVASNLGAFSV